MSTDPTAEHIDAVARAWNRSAMMRRGVYENAEAVLTSTDPDVHAALLAMLVNHRLLTEEWAVRYERDGDPTMDNPSGVRTQTSVVANRALAEQAVKLRVPLSSAVRNRRVVSRLATEWEDQ